MLVALRLYFLVYYWFLRVFRRSQCSSHTSYFVLLSSDGGTLLEGLGEHARPRPSAPLPASEPGAAALAAARAMLSELHGVLRYRPDVARVPPVLRPRSPPRPTRATAPRALLREGLGTGIDVVAVQQSLDDATDVPADTVSTVTGAQGENDSENENVNASSEPVCEGAPLAWERPAEVFVPSWGAALTMAAVLRQRAGAVGPPAAMLGDPIGDDSDSEAE